MIDFNKSLAEIVFRTALVCAHRGIASGSIPCNTIPLNAALCRGGYGW